MNTPAHMAVAWAALGGRDQPSGRVWYVLLGALLPDAALFALFYDRGAQLLTQVADILNSVLVYGLLLGLAALIGARALMLVAAAALLHIALDLPLHALDAHAHFWPATDWRFISPVSFWDADHHGRLFGLLEAALFAGCLAVIWRRQEAAFHRVAVAGFGALYVFAFAHFLGHAFADQHWALW